ncbi:MAG: hypothetical protein M1816_005328 [Peltula sp. TS41687]|nr:MAG: hypothetical protein M1816_005328 [Peltula sp. TS41687]
MVDSTTRAHKNRDDINANGEDKKPPCVRCLKYIASTDPLRLSCRVMGDYDGARKCGRCVGLGKPCFDVPTPLLGQANKLVAEFKRVAALPPGAGRVPEIQQVRKMSTRFAHREQSYQIQLKKAVSETRGAAGAKVSGGRVGFVSALPGSGVGGAGGESVRDKLDRVIANGQELIASGEETNRLLRSLEGMGERLLAAGRVTGNYDSGDDGEDDDATGDDGGDAEMADDV